jgi:tRNA(Ile)-lysidine synthase
MFTLRRFADELDGTLAPLGVARPPLCVALSGGLDSTVLLVALARLRGARTDAPVGPLRALHVDHSLHADSANWSRACADLCADLAVPFNQATVEAGHGAGESPEAAARSARYDELRRRLHPGEVVLTAHHADDQLETILLQWLRGGGLSAVAGMARLARFGADGWHARPLLAFERSELLAWAQAERLRWVEDPSNADRRFDRNYLRHEVLAPLRARWPAAARTTGRIAGFAREALELEAAVAGADLAAALRGRALGIAPLLRLPEPRQRAALRAWLAGCGLPLPSARTLASLLRDVRVAAPDRHPQTSWPGATVRRYREHLHAEAHPAHVPRGAPLEWLRPETTALPWGDGWLRLVPDEGRGLRRSSLPATLHVTPRAGGEVFVPAAGASRRPLRKWLQEQGVLPWRRADLPLLLDRAGQLVAVADLAIGADFRAGPGEPSWRVQWEGRGAVTESDAFDLRWPVDPPIR